jgi:hypothetical protein
MLEVRHQTLLNQISDLSRQWHGLYLALGNGSNGDWRTLRELKDVDQRLDVLWQRRRRVRALALRESVIDEEPTVVAGFGRLPREEILHVEPIC